MLLFRLRMVGVVLCLCSSLPAQESVSNLRDALKDTDEIVVPKGSGDEVVEFLGEMAKLQQDIARDYQAAMKKISAAQAAASSQILDDAENISDELFYAAAKFGLATRIRGLANANEETQHELLTQATRQLSIGLEKGLQQSEISNAGTLASYLERYGDAKLAAEAYRTFSEMLAKVDNPNYKRYADQFAGSARRLGLLGNLLELEGKLLDGTEFDWAAYRGKVVLVDFWATWCGPCIAEAPNVRAQYDAYHDLGFEVVGISLDTKQSALEAYIKKEKVPWANLYQDGAGWKHPMAVKYGIRSIPSVFLVDRDGKVVSLNARGAELPKQLSKLFNSKSDWERAAEIYSKRITPNTKDAALIARRATAYAKTETWDAARADWDRAVKLQPELAQNAFTQFRRAARWDDALDFGMMEVKRLPTDTIKWLAVSPILILTGNLDAYREHCQAILQQFKENKDATVARRVGKVCLLLPGEYQPSELLQDAIVKPIMETALNSAWSCSMGAMLAYRSGDFELASKCLTKSKDFPTLTYAQAADLPMEAMVQHALGNDAAAEQALREAAQILETLRGDDANKGFHDLLIAEILFREAQATLRKN